MLKKIISIILVLLSLLLLACGEKAEQEPQSVLKTDILESISDAILYSFTEDRIMHPTEEETAAVISQLKKDFSLIQEIEAGPQEHPFLTFVMDTDDKQQLQIAVLANNDELILTYTKDTDKVAEKAFFSLPATALRKEIEQICARFMAREADGEKETLVFLGESDNWRAVLTVENIEWWGEEDNAITYDNETTEIFVLQYTQTDLANIGEVSYRYTTAHNSAGGDNEHLDSEGKVSSHTEGGNVSLIHADNEISVWVEWANKRETFDLHLDK